MRLLSSVLSLLLLAAVPAVSAQPTSAPSSTASGRHAVPDSSAPGTTDPEPAEVDEEPWTRTRAYVDDHIDDYVGTFEGDAYSAPGGSAFYRTPPPLRYNRVEGLVLGVRRSPLSLRDPDDTARIYGQLGYAFALDDLRYKVGLESRLRRGPDTGLKVGVAYQKQTLSPDDWKTSYVENSIGAFGFGYDFFDYYEAEGLSLYAVQAFPRGVRLAVGVRAEAHRPLSRNTRWSLFDAGSFRSNPTADRGRLHAGVVTLEGGRIQDRDDLPTGTAFRVGATLGTAFGGDFNVNRYEVDGRTFLPLNSDTRLGLRLRGGYATSGAPPQMQFALGGIGSVRSYDQNARRGTRMLLGNVEYIIDGATLDNDLLEDLYLVGLFDAGWVGQPGQQFRMDDVLPSAGFGIGLNERQIRLDVAWPLRDTPATGSHPSIWLRITPNF